MSKKAKMYGVKPGGSEPVPDPTSSYKPKSKIKRGTPVPKKLKKK